MRIRGSGTSRTASRPAPSQHSAFTAAPPPRHARSPSPVEPDGRRPARPGAVPPPSRPGPWPPAAPCAPPAVPPAALRPRRARCGDGRPPPRPGRRAPSGSAARCCCATWPAAREGASTAARADG
ncbi:MAG: hypothetical protein BUE48_006255 [Thermomonospora sp. CIF 1]|nr:MAG: hypothetical protein BUE48_006255 [Thermomonospora sp. CIF 1]